MIKFSTEFGNIDLTVTITHYRGDTNNLIFSKEDRADIGTNSAGVFQIHVSARDHVKNVGPLEYVIPVVVLGLWNEEEHEDLTKEEVLAEEAVDIIEDAFLEKIALHLELEAGSDDQHPPWAKK